jgi:hypothetical protein
LEDWRRRAFFIGNASLSDITVHGVFFGFDYLTGCSTLSGLPLASGFFSSFSGAFVLTSPRFFLAFFGSGYSYFGGVNLTISFFSTSSAFSSSLLLNSVRACFLMLDISRSSEASPRGLPN